MQCVISDSLVGLGDFYFGGVRDAMMLQFANMVLQTHYSIPCGYYFSDEEIELCRLYIQEYSNVQG